MFRIYVGDGRNIMDTEEILSKIDHTALAPESTWSQIKELCDDAIRYGTASVCVPPSFVGRVKDYVGSQMKICTVIGFPNGYNTTEVKIFETKYAVKNGADEIDMVINIGALKAGDEAYLENEISAVKSACGGRLLKVIIETCLLTDEEKKMMCRIVTKAGADYIKTSTGFSKGGATYEDIRLFTEYIGTNVRIKASGGISGLEEAAEFIRLGCARLGTSRIVKSLKMQEEK